MTRPPHRASASVAVILCALLAVSVTRPAVAVADTTPSPPTATTTTALPGSGDPSATTSTTSTTTTASTTTRPPGPATTAPTVPPPPTTVAPTTVPPPTTNTTLDPAQLAALIHGLDSDVAKAQALSDYLAAQAVASSAGAGQPLPAGADPVLVAAAAAQLRAIATQAAADQRFQQARHRIGRVAIALYLGVQFPRAGAPTNATLADRSAFLSGILDTEQRQARQAKADLARATADSNDSRRQADRLVQSRTMELQAVALRAAGAAQPPGTGAAGTPPGTAAAPGGVPGRVPGGGSQSLLIQGSPTILGPSVLSADELAGWFAASGHKPNLAVPLPVLAADYLAAGGAAGVRADLAFAQSILETGYFSFPGFGQVAISDNNFAGIGACDSCATGMHFPDALTGVQAQMQLLHVYARAGEPVAGPLPGPFYVAGCCQTWMGLTGVWATAADYGVKILKLYRSMVQWALPRRMAAARL